MKTPNVKFIFLPAALLMLMLGLTACVHQENTPFSTTPSPTTPTYVSPASAPISSTSLVASSETTPVSATPITRVPVIGDPVISELPPVKWGPPEFTFSIKYTNSSDKKQLAGFLGHVLQAKYITNHHFYYAGDCLSYDFEVIQGAPEEADKLLSITFPPETYYDIKLTPGSTYLIFLQFLAGFPSSYGLIISQGREIIFAGISDWNISGMITIDNGFFPMSDPSFNVIYEDIREYSHGFSIKDSDFFQTILLSVPFTLGDKTFTLREGQSAALGDYRIDLLRASDRTIIYHAPVCDGGPGNCFSFTFTKLIESAPLVASHLSNEPLNFSNPVIEKMVRDSLRVEGRILISHDLIWLSSLDGSKQKITDISGLEQCITLNKVNLANNLITDISPVSKLKAIGELNLDNNQIADVSPLAGLPCLRSLDLVNNRITDISTLTGLVSLSSLNLLGNKVTDISILKQYPGLIELNLGHNNIQDISTLASLPGLHSLDLSGNEITDFNVLTELKYLKKLSLRYMKSLDMLVLSKINVDEIDLRYGQITDISSLVENPYLKKGCKISLDRNPLNDKSKNEYIPQLKARGIEVKY